jgi:hypothetical protein
MKTINIVLSISLSVVSIAWAEVTDQQLNVSQQQLSKRPYAIAPVIDKNTINEGDISNEETNAKAEKNYKTLQLHMLSRRPYAEKGTN